MLKIKQNLGSYYVLLSVEEDIGEGSLMIHFV